MATGLQFSSCFIYIYFVVTTPIITVTTGKEIDYVLRYTGNREKNRGLRKPKGTGGIYLELLWGNSV